MVNVPVDFNSEALEQVIRNRVMEALIVCLNLVRSECEKAVPVDMGELMGSIRIESPKWITAFILEGKVLAGNMEVPQAYYTEEGTEAHGPVFARAMHFHWKGKEIYTKRVKGVKATHWMQASAAFSVPQIRALFKALEVEFRGWIFTTVVLGPSGRVG